jgi:hypothetical protein
MNSPAVMFACNRCDFYTPLSKAALDHEAKRGIDHRSLHWVALSPKAIQAMGA